MYKNRITVTVPASTANIGSGFDAIGLALELRCSVTVELGSPSFQLIGEGAGVVVPSEENIILNAMQQVFTQANFAMPHMQVTCNNGIPLARGLGSSSAAIVAGLVAANEICRSPFSKSHLLNMATAIEGHPDNVAPALLGGCQIAIRDNENVITSRIRFPRSLSLVAFIPDFLSETAQSRALLTPSVPRGDAIFNLSRAALLVNALTTGNFSLLRVATQDALHQNAREKNFRPLSATIQAALNAGAYGAFLSGAGPTVMAITSERQMTIGYEMSEAASRFGVNGEIRMFRPALHGYKIIHSW
jgi:homoserine kinase